MYRAIIYNMFMLQRVNLKRVLQSVSKSNLQPFKLTRTNISSLNLIIEAIQTNGLVDIYGRLDEDLVCPWFEVTRPQHTQP